MFGLLLAGAAGALGFEPVGLWPLTVLALAALLWLVERAPSLRAALARGWWFGVGHFCLGLNWIATAFTYQAAMPAWLGWVAVLLLSLYLAVYPAVAAGLAWRYGRGRPTVYVLLFAAAWILSEWLRATLFTGFAWNPAGVALLPTGLSWLAPWLGTYGLSGVAVLGAGTLLLALREEVKRAAAVLIVALLGSAAAAWAFAPSPRPGAGTEVRIVQPNIGQEQKWSPEFAARNMARLGALSRSDGARPRLLIWPEAAVTEPLQDERRLLGPQREAAAARAGVQRLLGPNDLLLTGGITVRSLDGLQANSATNSVFAIDSAGRILARYDKAHLVPYGEYLPMRPLLSAVGLSRLAPGDLDFDPGPGPRTLDLPAIGPVGFQLCYEMIFSGEVVERARRPAFLFNPSNDAWFGAWGPPQHLAQARLRALEEGLPVVRATPTGISAVIDARGRLLHALPLGQAGVIDARLPLAAPPTLFARLGNWLGFAFALLLVAAAIAVARKAR
ncbi:MAG TPA: apolipoprotein N-acyltransferase [Allosphingosinicella sp.]|nr:apolipoprotein N-acyltransferase [Allosphingosinicella sp.]